MKIIVSTTVVATFLLCGKTHAKQRGIKGTQDENRDERRRELKSKEKDGCFENKGFELLSGCLTKEPIPWEALAVRRRLDSTVDQPSDRQLGADEREPCMDLGGFPIYYSGGATGVGRTFLTCCPACEIYPQQDVLDEYCTPVSACGSCDGGDAGAMCIGFGTNPDVGDFFAYCCPNSDLKDFENLEP